MTNTKEVGVRIKQFRTLAALSKSDLARQVGVSPTAVHNWEENGVLPRMDVLLRLEKALEVSWMQLMGAGEQPREVRSVAAEEMCAGGEMSRKRKLDQIKRQIADLFEVSMDCVDVVIRA